MREHDRIDAFLREWCRSRSADDIVEQLWEAGVPVGKVMQPHHQPDLAQLASRNFFEEVDHPVIGPLPLQHHADEVLARSGADAPTARTASRRAQREVLGELGLTRSEIDTLEADGIIGDSLLQDT